MNLIELLKQFNRKERFHLLCHAFGCVGESFRLGDDFREALGTNIGVPVPSDALVAMDYHLDWIDLAIWLLDQSALPTKQAPIPHECRVAGNQQDIDLLVAFEREGTTHLVLIEAKGDMAWSNSQLKSKAKRLGSIFGKEIPNAGTVQPHFVMISPTASVRIKTCKWPTWMREARERQMALPWPYTIKPTRCNRDGNTSSCGKYVRIDEKNARP